MVYGPIHYDGDGGNVIVPFNKTDPATGLPFDNVAVTAAAWTLYDLTSTPAGTLASGSGVWDSNAKTWKITIAVSAFASQRTAQLTITPTRAASTPAALWPTSSIPLDFTDALSTLDAAQSQLAAIASGETTTLIVPSALNTPSSGSANHRVELIVIDDDTGAFADADSLPTLAIRDESGSAPSGVTVGSVTNTATGRYYADVAVGPTAPTSGQAFIEASFTEGGESRIRIRATEFQRESASGSGAEITIQLE